jgi:Glyoxalase/Bleomycin resistance protein/Dioxygenase superfamily
MLFDFGQPTNGIIQTAFVVADLNAAMAAFSGRLRAGPWTVLRNVGSPQDRYRDQPTQARAHIALGFAGHMQYELIQPADDLPSVFREVIEERGYGFHHFGCATTAFAGSVEVMHAQGYETVFSAVAPGGVRVAYFDTRDVLPGMTELIESCEALNGDFTAMYKASILPSAARQLA